MQEEKLLTYGFQGTMSRIFQKTKTMYRLREIKIIPLNQALGSGGCAGCEAGTLLHG